MALRDWLQPPRHLIALFLIVTLVPSLALVASGWRLLEQDLALSIAQLSERREQAADLVVSELERFLAAAEQALRDPDALRAAIESDDDVVGITFESDQLEAWPRGRLPFHPRTAAGVEAPAARFAEGEDLEFRQHALPPAIWIYRGLARSPDAALRAGALIRLARTLRATGATDAALGAYAEVAQLSGVAVGGVPADLLARWARCQLLESLQRSENLQQEAAALQSDLVHGRWQLGRATYELHSEDARRWTRTGAAEPGANQRLALALAVESLWNDWRRQTPDVRAGSGRRVFDTSAGRVTVVWAGSAQRRSALLVGSAGIDRQWLAKIRPALDRQRLRLALRAAAARGPEGAAGSEGSEARRTAAETGLPWTVAVEETDPQAELSRIAGRRTLWVWGLALLVAVTLGGIGLIARGAMRELAVARLQSDFVSAVSHEFRTPLTTLRQLTEVLIDGRVPAEERRETYYRALARQTDRLHRLVESLLDFGRIEAGTSPYRLEPLDACALVRSIVDEFAQDSAASGYRVELQVDSVEKAAPMVAADREALTHAVWNLLDNAVKYSPECRTVWVDVERTGSRLAIRVRDHGLGVPREEHADIFERFVRGAGAKAHGITGTGIGLALVRHIASAHGGSVSVDSDPGMGSTFTLVLPVVDPCPAS